MMDSNIQVITPAKSNALVSVPEAKLALNLSRSTDMVVDEQIAMFIEWASGQIAAIAGRVFGEEDIVETVRDVDSAYPYRIFLNRFPVSTLQSVTDEDEDVTVDSYELETGTGKITRIDGSNFSGPVVVKYTGGYKLPADAPMALKQAALLMARESYYSAIRGDATVRMVGHKETRVIYFDPNAALKALGGGAGSSGSPAKRAAEDLVRHFMRFPC
jgi:hypothetical protein